MPLRCDISEAVFIRLALDTRLFVGDMAQAGGLDFGGGGTRGGGILGEKGVFTGLSAVYPKTGNFSGLTDIVNNGTIVCEKRHNSMRPPISASGFLLGALLAATAAVVKILFLNEVEERREYR